MPNVRVIEPAQVITPIICIGIFQFIGEISVGIKQIITYKQNNEIYKVKRGQKYIEFKQKEIFDDEIIIIKKDQLIPATVKIIEKTQYPIIFEQIDKQYYIKIHQSIEGNIGDILPQNSYLRSNEQIYCQIIHFDSYDKEKYGQMISYKFQKGQLQKLIQKCNNIQGILYLISIVLMTIVSYFYYEKFNNNIEWKNEVKNKIKFIFVRIAQYIVYGYYFFPMNILQGIDKVRGLNNILSSVNNQIRTKTSPICKFNDKQGYEKLIDAQTIGIDACVLFDEISINKKPENIDEVIMLLTSIQGYIDDKYNTLTKQDQFIIQNMGNIQIQLLNNKQYNFIYQNTQYQCNIQRKDGIIDIDIFIANDNTPPNSKQNVLIKNIKLQTQTSIVKNKVHINILCDEKINEFILTYKISVNNINCIKSLLQYKQIQIYANTDLLQEINEQINNIMNQKHYYKDKQLMDKIILINQPNKIDINITNSESKFINTTNIYIKLSKINYQTFQNANICLSDIHQLLHLLNAQCTISNRLFNFISTSYYKNNILIYTNYIFQLFTQFTMQINTESFILLVYTTFLTFSQQITSLLETKLKNDECPICCNQQLEEQQKQSIQISIEQSQNIIQENNQQNIEYGNIQHTNKQQKIIKFNIKIYILYQILALINSVIYTIVIYMIMAHSYQDLSDLHTLYVFVINGLIFSFIVEQFIRQTHFTMTTLFGTAFTFLISYFMQAGATLGIFGKQAQNTLGQMYTIQGTIIVIVFSLYLVIIDAIKEFIIKITH